jgi:lia operon protein LiaG
VKRRFFVVLLFAFLFILSLGGLTFYKWVLAPEEGQMQVIDESSAYQAEQVHGIAINTTQTNVDIIRGESDEIQVELFGNGTGKGNATLKSEQTGDQLTVTVQHHAKGIFSRNNARLQVVLPARQFDRLQVKTTSGEMRVEGASAASLDLTSISGNIEAKGLEGEDLTVKTTSGEIRVDTWAGNATVTSVSGDQELIGFKEGHLTSSTTSGEVDVMDLVDGQDVRITTVSGDVEVNGELVSGQINTTSGEVTVDASQLGKELTLQSISGDLKVGLSGEAPYTLESRTVSGDVEINSANFTYTLKSKNQITGSSGDGGPSLHIKTTSGDQTISN